MHSVLFLGRLIYVRLILNLGHLTRLLFVVLLTYFSAGQLLRLKVEFCWFSNNAL